MATLVKFGEALINLDRVNQIVCKGNPPELIFYFSEYYQRTIFATPEVMVILARHTSGAIEDILTLK